MEIKAKAADLWDSMKGDIKDLLAQYNTFRPDKFEEFMRQDTRGIELFKLYKPGTPEYAEFFEEEMGPYLLELAKEKPGVYIKNRKTRACKNKYYGSRHFFWKKIPRKFPNIS